MNFLALDTSSSDASIAVLQDGDVLLEYNFTSRDNLSAVLVPSLEFVLKSLDMRIAQVDGFGIGIGPGLFTGIRIGMATLKGLAFAEKKPLVGVTSLMALACKLADAGGDVVSLIDAKKGEVYLGGYRFAGGEAVVIIPPCLLKIDDLGPALAGFPDRIFTGSGAVKHADYLQRTFPGSRLLQRSSFLASEIGRIALARFRRHDFLTDPQGLLPFYLRRPDAETNLARSAGD
jgi:tRNA threonylcarbamoyl adenosine modification protein YeaZ